MPFTPLHFGPGGLAMALSLLVALPGAIGVIGPAALLDTDTHPASGDFADSLRSLMALPRFGAPGEIAALVTYRPDPTPASSPGPA